MANLVLHPNPANQGLTSQADFFIGYHVGAISQPEKFMGHSSCYADFSTHPQALRAMEDMDGMPLLGRKVDIEFAQESNSPSVWTMVESDKGILARRRP